MLINYDIAHAKLKADSADKKILELLSATKGFQIQELSSLSAKQLLRIADCLEITEASVRMALSRQTKQGKLVREHGRYSLVSAKRPFHLPRFWLDIRKLSKSWDGNWFLINLGGQKYTPTITRRLARKANLLGLQQIPTIGWIRPDNLINLHEEVQFHFQSVTNRNDFIMGKLSGVSESQFRQFTLAWPTDKLNDFYHNALIFITNERKKLAEMSDKDILMRSFTIGRLIIEQLSYDPWLPEQMIDAGSREKLIEETILYYQKIKPAWLNLLQA